MIVFVIDAGMDVYECCDEREREINRIKERTRSPLLYKNDLECFCIILYHKSLFKDSSVQLLNVTI